MSASDDEDMKRAIAVSLGQPDPGAQEVISLDSDDEAVGTSIAVSERAVKAANERSQSLGILGLDREAMELERLSRKRMASASVSPPPFARPRPQPPSTTATSASPSSSDVLEPQFLIPTVRKTYCHGLPRIPIDITLAEVLNATHLKLAVLSSFQWDIPWLFQKLSLSRTKITLVMQAKDEATKTQYRKETAYMGGNLRLCFPSMEGQINCMHSKLMLLSYENFLRVVVPTANLVNYDWGK